MTTFPDFTLPGSDGRNHSLADYKGRYLVVYFYPKDDTPGCTTQACGFRDLHSDFMRLDAAVLGVSADGLPAHQRFITKHGLPFVLLADTEHVLMDKLDVWQMKKLYGREFMGIVRTTFLVGPDSEIVREWRGVRVAGHVEEVLAAIAVLKGGGAPAAAAVPAEPTEIAAEPAAPAPVVIPEAGGTGAAMQPLPMKAPAAEPVAPAAPAAPAAPVQEAVTAAPVEPAKIDEPAVAPVAKAPKKAPKKPSAPAKKTAAPVAKQPVAPVAKKPVAKKPVKPAKKVAKPVKVAAKAKGTAKAKKPAKAKPAKAKPAKAKAAKAKSMAKPVKAKPVKAKPAKVVTKAKPTKKPAKKR